MYPNTVSSAREVLMFGGGTLLVVTAAVWGGYLGDRVSKVLGLSEAVELPKSASEDLEKFNEQKAKDISFCEKGGGVAVMGFGFKALCVKKEAMIPIQ